MNDVSYLKLFRNGLLTLSRLMVNNNCFCNTANVFLPWHSVDTLLTFLLLKVVLEAGDSFHTSA